MPASTRALLAAAAMAAATGASVAAAPLPAIRTSHTDSHFYDEFGRVRIFHGANRVCKHFPWMFPELLDPASDVVERMASVGFTAVRLGWMWSGYQPTQGEFNATYASAVTRIVQRLADHGIYTLLDMHQDVLSSKFCVYDGIPLWVVNMSTPKHPFPWPMTGNCSSRAWGANYEAEASVQCMQDIYDNKHGMQDYLAGFWKQSARVFAGNTAILGYELINEPFAGNFFEDPLIMLPGEAGARNLQPMYERLAAAIRPEDDEHIIFFEPVTWGMIFDNQIAGSGFTQVPGGPAYKNRSAFSYHYYCDTFLADYEDKMEEAKVVCDSIAAPAVFKAVREDVAQFGGAALMTEGLACVDKAMAECHAVWRQLDDHLYSWTDYGYSQDDEWAPSDLQMEAWARVYARAVAGQPTNVTFAALEATRDFEFCFVPDPAVTAPTEIFLGTKFNYPRGAAVECGAGLECVPATISPPNASAPPAGKDDVLLVTLKPGAAPVRGGEAQCVRIKGTPAQ